MSDVVVEIVTTGDPQIEVVVADEQPSIIHLIHPGPPGPPGPAGEGSDIADPGDLTLLFDNHLV